MNRPIAMRPTRPNRRTQIGLTLVETMVTTSVLAVLTGLAAPSFDGAAQRHHLEGATAQLETDIHCARSMAVARNAPLRISVESNAGASCYVIHTGAANQCSCAADGTTVCKGDALAERSFRFERRWPGEPGVELAFGAARPDPGHQHTDRHDASDDSQWHDPPPGDEHHGARMLLFAAPRRRRR